MTYKWLSSENFPKIAYKQGFAYFGFVNGGGLLQPKTGATLIMQAEDHFKGGVGISRSRKILIFSYYENK